MRGLYVPLSPVEREAIIRLANFERRDPRQQAALFIRQQLESLGLLQPQHRFTDTRAAGEGRGAMSLLGSLHQVYIMLLELADEDEAEAAASDTLTSEPATAHSAGQQGARLGGENLSPARNWRIFQIY